MTDLLTRASEQFQYCCTQQPRYRVGWIVGPPQRGKTALARRLHEVHGWSYLDYTLTSGYFDSLTEKITSYQPSDLITAMQDWSAQCSAPVLIIDEIDAVLATWDHLQRKTWVGLASRLQWLRCGLLIVSHIITYQLLGDYLPDHDQRYCLDLSGALS
jgi:SpoVK/Ycf46/Vps4 family AAA+-type ATPase